MYYCFISYLLQCLCLYCCHASESSAHETFYIILRYLSNLSNLNDPDILLKFQIICKSRGITPQQKSFSLK